MTDTAHPSAFDVSAATDATAIEGLLRYLDGQLPPKETAAIQRQLAQDPAMRAVLRDVAEQVVGITEVERRPDAVPPAMTPARGPRAGGRPAPTVLTRWQTVALATAASLVVVASGYSAWTLGRLPPARITRAVGATRLFSAAGSTLEGIPEGHPLRPGDTLESRSCDAWITTDLIGGQLTTAGDSVIRVLRPDDNERRFELVEGSLWIDPSSAAALGQVVVQTPTAVVESSGCLFDIRTSATDSVIRVHRGRARVSRQADDAIVDVAAGEQTVISLDTSRPPDVSPQPPPVDHWSLEPMAVAAISHAIVRPAEADLPARLVAMPLLWKEGTREPLLLFAAGVAAWMTDERPVRVESGSQLTFRGRMAKPTGIRVGLTTQRMQGVFAGKFEVDIPPERMNWDGDRWELTLLLEDLDAMNPQLATSPVGLEVGDVYVVTLDGAARIELFAIEIGPR